MEYPDQTFQFKFNMKQILRKFIALILAGLCFTSLPAQQKVFLHTDKAFYVSGEKIWYSLYLPTALQDKSYVLKLFAVDAKGKILGDYYLRTNGKSLVGGYYNIPFEASTGSLRLAFYAEISGMNFPSISSR